MTSQEHQTIDHLVAEEIDHIVSRAARHTGFLRAGEHAYRLFRAYPNSGKSGRELVNAIVTAAAKKGVAVEISQPYA